MLVLKYNHHNLLAADAAAIAIAFNIACSGLLIGLTYTHQPYIAFAKPLR
jgi:hypothetical protein